jgi:hypothetical protein
LTFCFEGSTVTEADWLVCTDPIPMLEFLGERASSRKLRLFAFACDGSALRYGPGGNFADDAVDRFVSGAGNKKEVRGLLVSQRRIEGRYHSHQMAKYALSGILRDDARIAAKEAAHFASGYIYFLTIEQLQSHTAHPSEADASLVAAAVSARAAETVKQAQFLRDIFGNPFRPVVVSPSCSMPAVVALAQAIYDDGAFDRLPSLADAFERVGCSDAAVIDHCRQPGPHLRGCWVLDLILSKK